MIQFTWPDCGFNYALKQQSLCWFSVSLLQFLISIFHLETPLQALLTFDGLFFLLCLTNNPKWLIRKCNGWNWLQTFVTRSCILIHFLYFVLQNVPTRLKFLCPSKCHRCTMWPHIKHPFQGVNGDISIFPRLLFLLAGITLVKLLTIIHFRNICFFLFFF